MDIHLLERLKDIVRSAGTTVRSAQDAAMGIREKSSHVDLVTLYDPMVQEFLRSRLLTLLPEAGFLGEEDATHDIAGRRQLFIVDPIDGTMNFIRGLHHSSISVALAVDGVVTHAVVYNPYYDEMFSAQRGLDYKGGMLVTNPIPEEYSMDKAVIDKAIEEALAQAKAQGIHGKETTPFLLAKVVELTGGDSLESNIQLVLNNARLAAKTAAALA